MPIPLGRLNVGERTNHPKLEEQHGLDKDNSGEIVAIAKERFGGCSRAWNLGLAAGLVRKEEIYISKCHGLTLNTLLALRVLVLLVAFAIPMKNPHSTMID